MSRSRQPSNLTIQPPSPNHSLQSSFTPTLPSNLHIFPQAQSQNIVSPRRAPLPPSPTQSNVSGASSNYHPYDDRRPRGSSDVGRPSGGYDIPPPPVPLKNDKRLPPPPAFSSSSGGGGGGGVAPPSPHRREGGQGKGWAVGVYDNKLVSSTLSHLPPLPSLSPTPPANSSSSMNPRSQSNPSTTAINYPTQSSAPRPSLSSNSSVVLLPDGTALPTSLPELSSTSLPGLPNSSVRGVKETIAHSRPDSPWSVLMIHVLPLFAGSPLKSSIEELNVLCHQHIVATSQRAPPSRIVALLTSDFTDFIGSGMMTLKSKIETLEDGKVIQRLAEIWSFFWAQNLPYLEGIFVPFTQVRDLASSSSISATTTNGFTTSSTSNQSPIAVRHLLLSGFLLHILLPLLPRLVPLVTQTNSRSPSPNPSSNHQSHSNLSPPSTSDLARLLQMALVLSTQARYSSFFPLRESGDSERRDEEVRESVETLGKAIRWRIAANAAQAEQQAKTEVGSINKQNSARPDVIISASHRNSLGLQRGPSISQSGRYRRRGWRASNSNMGQFIQPSALGGGGRRDSESLHPNRQNSEYLQAPEQQWGRPRVDEEDEDEGESTPGQSLATVGGRNTNTGTGMGIRSEDSSFATTTGTGSTLTAGTYAVRGGESIASTIGVSVGGGGGDQRTPLADFGGRSRPVRADSSGSSDLAPVLPDLRRVGRT